MLIKNIINKNKGAVIEALDTKMHPIFIQRDAEDLLYSANEKMKNNRGNE